MMSSKVTPKTLPQFVGSQRMNPHAEEEEEEAERSSPNLKNKQTQLEQHILTDLVSRKDTM